MQRLLSRLTPFLAVFVLGLVLASCGGTQHSAPGETLEADPTPSPVPRTFAYVTNTNSGDVSIYQVGATGHLTPAGVVGAGDGAVSFTIHPSNRFAYTVNVSEDSVSAYSIDRLTGMLTFIADFPAGHFPHQMRIDPSGKFAYVTNFGSADVSIYKVDPGSGALEAAGALEVGDQPMGIAIDPSGTFVYVAAIGSISAYRILADSGALVFIDTFAAGVRP